MPNALCANTTGAPLSSYFVESGMNTHQLFSQLPVHESRRPSKSPSSRRAGVATRVTKSSSISNSPRSSSTQSRRREPWIGEGRHRLVHQPSPARPLLKTPEFDEFVPRPPRPVSWQPSTHDAAKLPTCCQRTYQPFAEFPFPKNCENDPYSRHLDGSPAAMVYSVNTSPDFSPMPLANPPLEAPCSRSPSIPSPTHWSGHAYRQTPLASTRGPKTSSKSSLSELSPCGTFAESRHGIYRQPSVRPSYGTRCTTPLTPEDVQAPMKPAVRIAGEGILPYESLAVEGSDGEVLYGMGLYDSPGTRDMDERCRIHYSTILSLLGGAPQTPNLSDKGLKLEESWEPSASDDEDDDANGDGTGQ